MKIPKSTIDLVVDGIALNIDASQYRTILKWLSWLQAHTEEAPPLPPTTPAAESSRGGYSFF